MLPIAPQLQFPLDAGDHLPSQLLDVVTELTEVLLEENAIMADGMPAAVVATLDRKIELSDAYEDLCAEVMETRRDRLTADPLVARRLMDAVLRLREVTAENLTRLEAAMGASRRRVEAVMTAMHSEARIGAPYGAKGDIPIGARLAAFGQDFHA